MSSFLKQKVVFARHNEECRNIWDAYHRRRPIRVPITVVGSIRNLCQNPDINTTGWTFEDFFKNPQAQIDCQLVYQKWCRYNLLSFGTPEAVKAHTRDCLRQGWGDGGHILCCNNPISESVPLRNYLAIGEAYREYFNLPPLG